jgi:predicted hydrocarbon binding protein
MEDRLITNKAFRVIVLGVQETTGNNGLNSLLNFSGLSKYIDNFPPDDLEIQDAWVSEATKLAKAIEDLFGSKGAKAILVQAGRMIGKWAISENPDVFKAILDSVSGKSGAEKAETILQLVAAAVSSQMNTKVWVERDGEIIYYKDETATYCFNRTSEEPICHVAAGFVYELVASQLPNSKVEVKETGCMAMNEPHCTYRVTIK